VSRDQPTPAILKISQGAKAIVLQFEEPVGMIEGFQRSSELGEYNRWQHAFILSRTQRLGVSGMLISLGPSGKYAVVF
jgi:hypothetical protein